MLSMSPSKRRDTDMMKLMMSDFEVHIPDESSMHDFLVAFPGPEDTPYTGGVWKVHVTLPKEYPFKSPSIGFENRMFHPNVDEMSGSVCLDVINQTWSPMFDLVNIFKLFIPQLLSYPNPTDPLNGEAAALLMRDPEAYAGRIRDCVRLYASDPVHLDGSPVIVATANTNTNTNMNTNASGSSNSSGNSNSSGAGSASAGSASAGSAIAGSASAGSASAIDGGGGSSGGRSNSIGSDTSGISGISSGSSGISGISDESDSSSEDKPPATAADDANGDRGDSAGGSGSGNRRENDDNEGGPSSDNDVTMGESGKAGDVKRRDSAAGSGGGNSCRSSSSSEFMMEMEMDETASDVSALSDVDG